MLLPTDITLKAGDSGDYVRELQQRLAQRELLGQANITSFFDGITSNAVMEFQSLNGLRSDGIAGPETLRRLISIGSGGAADGDGSSNSEEEEKEKFGQDLERVNEYALEAQPEQDKLANEAVWGYAAEATNIEGQQQLSDLDRYNQQHEQVQQQTLVQQQEQTQALMRGELMDEAKQNGPEQLEINQQEIKAQTLAEDLEKAPEKPEPEKEVEKTAEREMPKELPQTQHEAARDVQAEQAQSPEQAQTALAAPAPRDPALVQTEANLDTPSQQESQQEGQKLDRQGVQNNGTVPETALGDLSPDRSPAVQREQEIGRG